MHALCFVPHEDAGLAQLAQILGDFVVLGTDSCTGIDHKHDHIGLRNGLPRLFRHLHVDALAGIRLETSGVHHDEFPGTELPVAVVPITSEPREISHDGVTRLGEAVEERGLAHIGASD